MDVPASLRHAGRPDKNEARGFGTAEVGRDDSLTQAGQAYTGAALYSGLSGTAALVAFAADGEVGKR